MVHTVACGWCNPCVLSATDGTFLDQVVSLEEGIGENVHAVAVAILSRCGTVEDTAGGSKASPGVNVPIIKEYAILRTCRRGVLVKF